MNNKFSWQQKYRVSVMKPAFLTHGLTVILNQSAALKILIIIIFLYGLVQLTCYGIDALPLFPGASTISSSSRLVVEGMFRESSVIHSFKVVNSMLFVLGAHFLYSRNL
jgi:hypothetical protein